MGEHAPQLHHALAGTWYPWVQAQSEHVCSRQSSKKSKIHKKKIKKRKISIATTTEDSQSAAAEDFREAGRGGDPVKRRGEAKTREEPKSDHKQ